MRGASSDAAALWFLLKRQRDTRWISAARRTTPEGALRL